MNLTETAQNDPDSPTRPRPAESPRNPGKEASPATFHELVDRLKGYWSACGVAVVEPYDVEVGAGTMSPHTFLRAIGLEPWSVAYVQPSRRPADGRYGDNANRLFQHHQFQVLIKPAPDTAQQLFLDSLRALGIDPREHDVRFVEDDWEAPTLGAWGLGWEVWCDGTEITQVTYFQQCGGLECRQIPLEITYGLERLAMVLQGVDAVFDLEWSKGLRYRELYGRNELEMSRYALDDADPAMLEQLFAIYEREALRLARQCHLALPAFDYALKASHVFNLLDARGAMSVSERARGIERVRHAACACAAAYLATSGVAPPPSNDAAPPPSNDGPVSTVGSAGYRSDLARTTPAPKGFHNE